MNAQAAGTRARLLMGRPCLLVKDLERATVYYRDTLGFTPRTGDAGGIILERDGVGLLIRAVAPGEEPRTNATIAVDDGAGADLVICCTNADALFRELAGEGALVAHPPIVVDGARSKRFAIFDLDGHVITFHEELAVITSQN